ncbi:MAG: response regulator transcription factor [Leptospiraceae bacterium]|nr:response regulator transcription factor [Leptospiraceae bacterium]
MDENQFKGYRILVVDDEKDICDVIRFNLEAEGFVVSASENGLDAWNKIERNTPDAVILDFMLPGISGLDLCKKIKDVYHNIPVLMVTARSGETDAVLCLELGADDYIRKPFAPRELTARLRAVLRRASRRESHKRSGVLQAGQIEMDLDAHIVTVAGNASHLTMIEYDMLRLFMENPRIAFTRDKLLDRIWGRDVYVSDRIIDVNIKRLREKLGAEKKRLETVRGVGYRFTNDPE